MILPSFSIISFNSSFPNDIKILQLYKKYNDEFKNLVKEFENKFYPLKTESANSTTKWEWLEGKWPWEGEKDV